MAAPAEAQQSLAQLAFDFLEVFYGLDSEFVSRRAREVVGKGSTLHGGRRSAARRIR